ncbi:hypothetical protein [Chitinophaga agri]|uniref:Uncharacterized protein n=1 Tax=Chitinophaga agri TaxID=2703787 RepID=A0A6B9ZP94_9BACT|nr:hypothetical protein [Chitinophaga agri]QHS63461.1 hypothetical protein GWR21_28910 [Chitinophaga agri]
MSKHLSIKGVIWILLITVFAVKSCDFFIHYGSSFKAYDIENAGDEAPTPDKGEDCFKSVKKIFSYFGDDILSNINWAAPLSTQWCVYSFFIFKEPLRDVLTPPPNHHTA